MMNLCKLLASKRHDILITFVVTEEWLGFISSDAKPNNIHFASIPNVIPSELIRGDDFPGFYEAVMTIMEVPFEQLRDQLEPPVTTVIADTELFWVIRIGNSKNIPVASLCTTSATVNLMLLYIDHIQDYSLLLNLLEHGDDFVDSFPGISSRHVADLRTLFNRNELSILPHIMERVLWVPKAQYLLFNSVYQLEGQVYDTLKTKFSSRIYSIGPAIPFFEFKDNSSTTISPMGPDYLEWLDLQPVGSVLYVALGSFLPISSTQMDEIFAGLQSSGVRYLLVARGETSRLKMSCGDMGLVVPWCNQLKVLWHSSVGGFWTHCGWNSTLEALFAGISMLTFPICFDQVPNSRKIVNDWKIGWRVTERAVDGNFVTREEIAKLVQRFMDKEIVVVQNMRKRSTEIREICHQAIAKGGSSETNLASFINDISQG